MAGSICRRCGSRYEIREHRLLVRDSDSITCDVCGHELKSWNGAVMYSSTLVERAPWPPEPGEHLPDAPKPLPRRVQK